MNKGNQQRITPHKGLLTHTQIPPLAELLLC